MIQFTNIFTCARKLTEASLVYSIELENLKKNNKRKATKTNTDVTLHIFISILFTLIYR